MTSSNSFSLFMEEKPLFYKEIDHERVHVAYAMLKPYLEQPLTIHVVGTNGKGSTGRIMATLLHASGKKVGHFSSPHILKFNERIWINGADIEDRALDEAHEKLYSILGKEMSAALSYFEYTTLLAFVAMQDLELMILEAGLGGEFDATNVMEKELSVITPIGLDHQDFLGETIKEIATTKMNSINKEFVLAFQKHDEVYDIANQLSNQKKATMHKVENFEKNYPKEFHKIKKITESLSWTNYLFENTLLAICALKKLDLSYALDDLKKVTLFGRFYSLSSNVTIDVGHNLLAAKAIVLALEKKYQQKKIVLVYNALNDKDYVSILKLFKPYVKQVEIIEINTVRAVELEVLEKVLKNLDISYNIFNKISEKEEYFVFGSFYVVEEFLSKYTQNINLH